MILKYQVTVIRTDVFNVEIDDNVFNEEWAKKFSSYMYDVDIADPAREAAKNIAIQTSRQGKHEFIEGFGIIPVKDSLYSKSLKERGEKIAKGVTIEPIIFDEDFETEIEYLEEGGKP